METERSILPDGLSCCCGVRNRILLQVLETGLREAGGRKIAGELSKDSRADGRLQGQQHESRETLVTLLEVILHTGG